MGDAVNATAELVANATNATVWIWELNRAEIADKFTDAADTLEPGLALAYGMLVVMALVPIFLGSRLSVNHMRSEGSEGGEETEVMTSEDAAMFPVYASCALFGLFCLFKVFGKEYVNMLVGGYFFFIGLAGATRALRPLGVSLLPASLMENPYEIVFKQLGAGTDEETEKEAEDDAKGDDEAKKDAKDALIGELTFDHIDLVCLALSTVVGVIYVLTKHWLTCNFFGLTLAINAVELLNLGTFKIAATLLVGLFFYDIFWVFGTNVMVTVAKSFDGPIKVLFPKDFMENGVFATENAMLGLGDIVLPGVLIALLYRFDVASGRTSRPYFWCTFIAYFLGLVFTIVIMHTFKAAQPALLYLVPAVLITPIFVSVLRGELSELLSYSEEEKDEDDNAKDGDESKKDK
mmetsp:Transcript_36604/g.95858  ORF Transcript_36604/g.95858 Transcript_36604/m.95858 type:complete len:406 (-) Transcript_36604:1472-2689(-)|eukprot:CAMPEP_0182922014 /NCGR_PEP_ID=MMETSP0105_2-20130417/4521_1 /TAXON_ID=81532 ORGANISM="Acanthoeca-like sp., Strain 10tr" /NCGR_SAMPLE_ID=MMETSP0105_2 /ASSEMBLY_ACC=CAM_ASM_000205 /LENGTH=405 /DNA_ID=CAMNT_0025059597 /DNA_START=35 /DNA_END=1252 /DNA_ORIENTATION=-